MGYVSRAWARGSTRAWRKLRLTVLAQHGYRCQLRCPGEWPVHGGMARCLGRADCVHHTLGRAITGDDPTYLTAACTPCNAHIGDPTRAPDPPPQPRTRW